MEEYKIKIYPVAKKDLLRIIDYINDLSPISAVNQYERLVKGILSLSNFPNRCPLLKNDNLSKKGYRCLVIDNYLVIFIVKGFEVQIRIIYNKRKYEFLIEVE